VGSKPSSLKSKLRKAKPFRPSNTTDMWSLPKPDTSQYKKFSKSHKNFAKNKYKIPNEKYNVIIPENLQEIGIKGKNLSKNELEKLKVKYDEILQDYRTTIMIKNIPNKYSQSQLQKEYLNITHEGMNILFIL